MQITRYLIGTCLLLISALLSTLPLPAYAHPDFLIANQTFPVDPGKFLEFPLPVHYHRIVGSFEVVTPEGNLVNVLVMDDQAFTRYVTGQPASQLYSSGRINKGTLDILIHCCIRSGTDESGRYSDITKYHLVIDNRESSSPTTVKLQVDLLHDGIAVIIYYGEPFAVVQVGGLFVLIPAIWSLVLMKRAKSIQPEISRRVGRKLVLFSLGSAAILFIIAISAYGFSAAIERAYGESAVADLSFPLGLAGEALSIAAIAIPWIFAVHLRRNLRIPARITVRRELSKAEHVSMRMHCALWGNNALRVNAGPS